MQQRFTYGRAEKLKSKKLIGQLFSEGQSVSAFPLRLVFLKTEFEENIKAKTGVSVSKRQFKRAVDRNRIKRLMREAYRLNKHGFFNIAQDQYAVMILYLGKDMPDFASVEQRMKTLFGKFLKKIEN